MGSKLQASGTSEVIEEPADQRPPQPEQSSAGGETGGRHSSLITIVYNWDEEGNELPPSYFDGERVLQHPPRHMPNGMLLFDTEASQDARRKLLASEAVYLVPRGAKRCVRALIKDGVIRIMYESTKVTEEGRRRTVFSRSGRIDEGVELGSLGTEVYLNGNKVEGWAAGLYERYKIVSGEESSFALVLSIHTIFAYDESLVTRWYRSADACGAELKTN